jgi:hypothetical protein
MATEGVKKKKLSEVATDSKAMRALADALKRVTGKDPRNLNDEVKKDKGVSKGKKVSNKRSGKVAKRPPTAEDGEPKKRVRKAKAKAAAAAAGGATPAAAAAAAPPAEPKEFKKGFWKKPRPPKGAEKTPGVDQKKVAKATAKALRKANKSKGEAGKAKHVKQVAKSE